MRESRRFLLGPVLFLGLASCGSPSTEGPSGGANSNGGAPAATGGSGGAPMTSGGTTTNAGSGGSPSDGGAGMGGGTAPATGGSTTGGMSAGGANAGGSPGTTGGSSSNGGGPAKGGSANGGAATGGTSNAGSGGSVSGGAGGGTQTSCTFKATATISKNISTVAGVEWSTTLTNVDSAQIDFGLDTNYGLSAPVDLKSANYRTLLLGMKAAKTYHYRIVAKSGAMQCTSPDYTVMTGALPNNVVPRVTINTPSPSALARGYFLTGIYQTGPTFILDGDGEVVWWYQSGETTRSHMSYDGKYMWIGKGNVPQGTAKMVRVAMDGSDLQDLSSQFKNLNHDFTVLPDETVAFIAYDNGCDKIVERAPNGTTRDIINIGKAQNATVCHGNSIHYSKADDSLIVSDLDQDSYIKFTRQGQVTWTLGGKSSSFKGAGATWDNQHGFHILAPDKLVMFNNGPMGAGAGSLAIDVQLDLTAKTAARTWTYTASPSIANNVMGDVQRLDNGNTLVTYSTQGVVHEVDASGKLLQSLSWGLGGAIGYSTKRKSLYGPPPR